MNLQASYQLTPLPHLPSGYPHELHKQAIKISFSGFKHAYRKPTKKCALGIAEPVRPYHKFQQLKVLTVKAAPLNSVNIDNTNSSNCNSNDKSTTTNRQQNHRSNAKASALKKSKTGSNEIAALNLQGKWLEQAEFSIGKRCLVEVYSGMLVITLDEPVKKPNDKSK